MSEGAAESLSIQTLPADAWPKCTDSQRIFERLPEAKVISSSELSQPLDSEIGEEAEYLKAARVGQGIYVYLPYFRPIDRCKVDAYEIRARHILWNGVWHRDSLKVDPTSARQRAVYLTNGDVADLRDPIHLDDSLGPSLQAELRSSFDQIRGFYRATFKTDPMENVGVVAAIVRNGAAYRGFGGDSLNIIRLSYDNPRPEDMPGMPEVFSSVFAHELFHKLQSDRLFHRPMGRYVTEGSADFMKVVALENIGLIPTNAAKYRVAKAVDECARFATSLTMKERFQARSVNYREPYDCGMAYFFAAYYASNQSDEEFLDDLMDALKDAQEVGTTGSSKRLACLRMESTCARTEVLRMLGSESEFKQGSAWLQEQLQSRPFPRFQPRGSRSAG
ncbi:hypothetical protein CDL60_05075 [Roseateles noduli]|nr:hypothetical protein CDL60_05075 [Roseateles noduli]